MGALRESSGGRGAVRGLPNSNARNSLRSEEGMGMKRNSTDMQLIQRRRTSGTASEHENGFAKNARRSTARERHSIYSGADEIAGLEVAIEADAEMKQEEQEAAAEEQKERFDVSEIPASWALLIPLVSVFFMLYVLQTFAFDMMKRNGLPWKGEERPPELSPDEIAKMTNREEQKKYEELARLYESVPDKAMWALSQDIPGYLAMCFVIYLPCKKTIWDLSGRQILHAMLIGPADLAAQVLSKTGLALTSPALYTIFSSGGSILFTALAARFIVRKRFNLLMWIGLLVMIGGVGLYGSDKASSSTGADYWDFCLGTILILLGSVADGFTFVLTEKFSNDGKDEIPGPLLTGIMGFTNLMLLLVWQCAWVLPRFDAYITKPMAWIQKKAILRGESDEGLEAGERIARVGRAENILAGFLFLFIAGVLVRAATMYMLKQVGAVTFVVIKMMKIVAVVFLSSPAMAWVSWSWWPEIQKHNWKTITGAALVTLGVGIYSYAKIRQKHLDAKSEDEKKEEQDDVEALNLDEDGQDLDAGSFLDHDVESAGELKLASASSDDLRLEKMKMRVSGRSSNRSSVLSLMKGDLPARRGAKETIDREDETADVVNVAMASEARVAPFNRPREFGV
eukprot:g16160.t1